MKKGKEVAVMLKTTASVVFTPVDENDISSMVPPSAGTYIVLTRFADIEQKKRYVGVAEFDGQRWQGFNPAQRLLGYSKVED